MKAWNKVGVVGAGTMGSGIAQIAAQAGCEVILVDSSAEALQRSQEKLAKVSVQVPCTQGESPGADACAQRGSPLAFKP